MLGKRFSWIASSVLFVGFFCQSTVCAQSFRVAHTSDGFSSFIYAAINDSGEVVFSAIRTNGLIGVYKSTGLGFKPLIEGEVDLVTPFGNGQLAPFHAVNAPAAINGSGTVAIEGASQVLGGIVVYVGKDAITPQSFQNNRDAFTVFNSALVLSGEFTLNDQGAFSLGALSVVPPTVALGFDQCFPCVGEGMDNQNEVPHLNRGATTRGGTVDLIRLGFVKGSGPFSALEPVATNHVATIPEDMFAGDPQVNSMGMVAYTGNRTNGTTGIYLGSGVPVIESPPAGAGEFILSSINFGLNNNGGVAFLATSRTWGFSRKGFFRGSNPLTDKIVLEGDLVAGSALSGFGLPGNSPGHWYNTAGQIVFQAFDGNGGSGLYVTSGVESSPPDTNSAVVEWVGPNDPPPGTAPNGSFTDASAWKPLNGDPPRVPQKTATLDDTALFDRAEQYTVGLGAEHADRMIIKNGNVTFTNGVIQLDDPSFAEPSMIVDNARLTLSFDPTQVLLEPMVTCNHALIGQSGAARVDIINDGEWLANGSLRVGGAGEGILTLDSGGRVTSSESRIGGAGGGHVNIGDGGTWTTGNLAAGVEGQGDLTIQDGGHVETDAGFIGLQGSSGNRVLLQGGNGNNVSRWDVAYLAIGGGGDGELDVKDGAFVNSALAIIAQVSGGNGLVTVSGVDTNGQSSTVSAGALLAGQNGNAELNVLDGGRVDAGNIFLGEYRSSVSAKVSGINVAANIPSTLHADRLLAVGDIGPATLQIDSGGQVESEWGEVNNFIPQTTSEVKIIGSASSWVIQDSLTVGTDASLNPGQSIVTLVDGYLQADSIEVDNGGIVRGFGTLAVDPTNRVVNAGGTISPGFSPGTITIDGNFQQLAGGQLLMDIGGTNYTDNDHLIISNAAILDGNITFRFLNGFAPKQGQRFDLLSVGGTLTGNFASVGIENLAPGFLFGLVTNGPALSLVASNDAVFSAALPGQVDVTVTNLGGITYASYIITTSNSCQIITLDGPLTQTGNAFTQLVSGVTFIRTDCADGILIVTNTLFLGALAPGDYTLSTLSAGQTMNTLSFTVPPNGGQALLAPAILADGSLQFQVAGPPSSLHCTIQASPDLRTWVNLGSGTLPFTFTDPDAVLFRQRYYRALIGP